MARDARTEIASDVKPARRKGFFEGSARDFANLSLPAGGGLRSEVGAQDGADLRVARWIHLAGHEWVRGCIEQELGGSDAARDRELPALGRGPNVLEAG
jgi:hypothetical protein